MSIILDEAKKVVYERNATYGQPEDNFAITAELWSAYLGVTIKPEDVGMMMILLKVAREKYQHKHDNLVDIAGYAECVARLNQKEKQRFDDNDNESLLNVTWCAGCERVVPEKSAVFYDGLPYCLQCNEEFSKIYAECVARLSQKGQQHFNDNGYDPRLNVRCAGCGWVFPYKLAVLSDGLMYCLKCNEEFSKTGRSMTDDSK